MYQIQTLRVKFNVRLVCPRFRLRLCAKVGLGGACGKTAPNVVCPRALGFSGESVRDGGLASVGSGTLVPVTRLRTGGRVVPVPFTLCGPAGGAEASGMNSSLDEFPSACRLAFSCLFCTARKCDRSSFHLMSSRPIFERVADMLVAELRHK